jgi:hypothetical protein
LIGSACREAFATEVLSCDSNPDQAFGNNEVVRSTADVDRRWQERPVLRDGGRSALDVREQQRDRAGWKLGGH